MAEFIMGPNGLQFGGTPDCSNNLLLGDVTNPGSVLKERLLEQYFKGIKTTRFEDVSVDDLMPMRASTSQRVGGVDEYRVAVGFDGISNSGGLISAAQPTAAFDLERTFLNRCGTFVSKELAARGNTNAEGCNPVIDGPFPYVGLESMGREPFFLRAPILPLCTQDYVNKDPGVWASVLKQIIQTTIDGNLYRWQLGKMRWAIAHTRFATAPIQVNLGNGRANLPVSPDLFNEFGLGHIPTHWGSPDWFSGMIAESEIPRRQNVTVEIPVAILMKYKEYYIQKYGINLMEGAANTTSAINGYMRTMLDDSLIYRDEITGRTITFKGTTRPVFIEIDETGPAVGTWAFQEKWIVRDSETANQVMPRENPNWGRYACYGKTLAALVFVFADGEPPFYTEPMPDNNPDARVKEIIASYGGGNINATLRDLYPSSMEVRLLTGLDAQVHLVDKLNQQYRNAGWTCDKFSNLENTYVGGYVKIGGVFVENRPREFMVVALKMPNQNNSCVDLSVAAVEPDPVPAAIELNPLDQSEARPAMVIPEPPEPPAAPAGTIQSVGRLNFKAPCTGTKLATLRFTRVGGSAGALSLAIAGTASAHASGLPVTVAFADGEVNKEVTFTLAAWVCPDADTPVSESFVLTFGPTNLTPGAFATKTVCIHCNTGCATGDCEPIGGSCSACGGTA